MDDNDLNILRRGDGSTTRRRNYSRWRWSPRIRRTSQGPAGPTGATGATGPRRSCRRTRSQGDTDQQDQLVRQGPRPGGGDRPWGPGQEPGSAGADGADGADGAHDQSGPMTAGSGVDTNRFRHER